MLLFILVTLVIFANNGFALPASAGFEFETTTNLRTPCHRTPAIRTSKVPTFTYLPTTATATITTPLPAFTLTVERGQEFFQTVGKPSTTLSNTRDDKDDEKGTSWSTPATYTLICYDLLIAVPFVWCWVRGCFGWWRKEDGGRRGFEMEELGRRGGGRGSGERVIESEMRRLGMI